MTSPSISVVLPFWNPPGDFMREAVDSVIAQTCDDWELILADDGSADESTSIAREYETSLSPRVRYLAFPSRQHRGLTPARNLGLAAARGRYVALLDADDTWSPVKLEEQRRLLEAEPRAAMVYGRSLYWHGWTGRAEDIARDTVQEHAMRATSRVGWFAPDRLAPPPLLLSAFLRGDLAVPPPSGVMLRRAVIDEVGGPEEPFLLYEDQSLYAKVGLVHPILVSSCQWERYRQHDASLCSAVQRPGAVWRERKRYLDWLARYVRLRRIRDRTLLRAIRQEQWRAHMRSALGNVTSAIPSRTLRL